MGGIAATSAMRAMARCRRPSSSVPPRSARASASSEVPRSWSRAASGASMGGTGTHPEAIAGASVAGSAIGQADGAEVGQITGAPSGRGAASERNLTVASARFGGARNRIRRVREERSAGEGERILDTATARGVGIPATRRDEKRADPVALRHRLRRADGIGTVGSHDGECAHDGRNLGWNPGGSLELEAKFDAPRRVHGLDPCRRGCVLRHE